MRKTILVSLGNRVQLATRGRSSALENVLEDGAWAELRGSDQFRGTFDVIGNFPGYAPAAALIVGSTLVVTDRYLIVDEWAPHGFAINLLELLDVSIDADPDTFEDIVVRYREESGASLFRLRVTRSRLPVRSKSKAPELMAMLSSSGVAEAELAKSTSDAFSASWESLHAAESDAVVWKGRVTAPLRPGRECAPTDVWVTPSALIWGSSKSRGVNRVPLSSVERLGTITLSDVASSPAIYIRVVLTGETMLDLPFIFNQAGPTSGEDQRASLLAIFRGDAIQNLSDSPSVQPWSTRTHDHEPEDETSVDSPHPDPESDPTDTNTTAGSDDEHPEDGVALSTVDAPTFETWTDVRRPTSFTYGAGDEGPHVRRIDAEIDGDSYAFDSSGTRLADAITSWPGLLSAAEETIPEPEPITEPKALLTYLATARRSIDEVNEAVDRRIAGQAAPLLRALPPSSDDQSKALAELIELAGTDYYSVEQARTVKSQITRLGEASVRLRSLLELCNAGHMTIAEVGLKRDVIMSGLPTDDSVE